MGSGGETRGALVQSSLSQPNLPASQKLSYTQLSVPHITGSIFKGQGANGSWIDGQLKGTSVHSLSRSQPDAPAPHALLNSQLLGPQVTGLKTVLQTIDGSESDRHSTFDSNSSTLRGLSNLVLTLFKGSVNKVSVAKGCLSGSPGGPPPNPGKGCGGVTRGGSGVVKVRPKQSLKLELMRPPMP
eukprot:scaffold21473_cov44-Attheya_sp.AAC.1